VCGGGGGTDIRRPGSVPAAGHQHREECLGGGDTGRLFSYFERFSAGAVPEGAEEEGVAGMVRS